MSMWTRFALSLLSLHRWCGCSEGAIDDVHRSDAESKRCAPTASPRICDQVAAIWRSPFRLLASGPLSTSIFLLRDSGTFATQLLDRDLAVNPLSPPRRWAKVPASAWHRFMALPNGSGGRCPFGYQL
jgi:hypothetical protein